MVERLLLLDTCTELGFVAYSDQGSLVFQASLGGMFDSAQSLVPVLDQQLKENGLALSSVDAIAVTVGPGSYTGLRIGVVIAKTLAFALNKPLIGIPSVELYSPMGILEGPFAVLLDARMGGVYGATGQMHDGLATFQAPFAMPIEQLDGVLHGIRIIVSPHAMRLQDKVSVLRSFEWHQATPSGKRMEEAARLRLRNGDFSEKAEVEILYLRKTQAEIEREKAIHKSNT